MTGNIELTHTESVKNKKRILLLKLCYGAVSLALCMVLPFLTGQIPEIGNLLCPMHLPVLICGAVGGPVLGGSIGLIAPLLRSLIFGMPKLFPNAVGMAVELLGYGVSFGILTRLLPKRLPYLYISLASAMLAGRLLGGVAKLVLLTFGAINSYGIALFWSGYFVEAFPGIILQLIIIPPTVSAMRRARLSFN